MLAQSTAKPIPSSSSSTPEIDRENDKDTRKSGLIPGDFKRKQPKATGSSLDARNHRDETLGMSITLHFDETALASLPFGPGERERHMQIELACRYYARGWLSLAQAARLAGLDHYAFGVELGERGIPRQYGLTEAQEDIAHARRQ